MGLFDKKYCDICGEKIGLFGNKKLADGNMCGDCQKKLSRWFSERRESSIAQIKEQLSYREANAAMLGQFSPTRQLGLANDKFVLIDDKMGRFVILREGESMQKNPDLFELSRVQNVSMEVRENRTEVKRKDANGNSVPFSPPHYSYRYQFHMTMQYDSPYFPEVKFQLTTSSVDGGTDHEQYRGEVIPQAGGFGSQLMNSIGLGQSANVVHTTQTGARRALPGGYRADGLTTMSLRDQEKYRECETLGNEIIAALTGRAQGGAMDAGNMIRSMAQTLMSGGMQSSAQALKLQAVKAYGERNDELAKSLYMAAAEQSVKDGSPDFGEALDFLKTLALAPERTSTRESDVQAYLDCAQKAQRCGFPADSHVQEAQRMLNMARMADPGNAAAAMMAAQQQAMMQAQQQAMMQQQAPSGIPAGAWQCSCGNVCAAKFCTECGAPKPAPTGEWTCSCGNVCSARFCTECGSPRP